MSVADLPTARPWKLRDGSWGAIVEGATPVKGDEIEIRPRSSPAYRAIVDAVLWSQAGQHGVKVLRLEPARQHPDLGVGGVWHSFDAYNNLYQWPNHDCVGDFGDW